MQKFEADMWYETIRLGKGNERKSIVGNIVTAYDYS